MSDEPKTSVETWVLRVATVLLGAGILGGIAHSVKTSNQIAVLEYQVSMLLAGKEADVRQDKTDVKHWKAINWARDEIYRLNHKAGTEPRPWDLD